MKISVIIPTYWNSDLCVVHVRESMNSSLVPDEIICCNDGGDPALRDKLFSLPRKCSVIYAKIHEDIPWNYGGVCNLGIWLSRGDFLTIEDVDHIPLRDAYKNAVQILDEHSEISRVGFRRQWVSKIEVLSKSFEEWNPYGGLGTNAMVAMYRRELHLDMRGQDERMRAYGWLAYDFKNRMDKLNVKASITNGFYIVKDGEEPNLQRPMSVENRRIYKENINRNHVHDSTGILRFQFSVERWGKNI